MVELRLMQKCQTGEERSELKSRGPDSRLAGTGEL